jgi:hypothetical protein
MAAEEFDLPLDHVVEGNSAVVDVVVAALAAMEFCLGCAIGHGECGTGRCLRVGFGDDEQARRWSEAASAVACMPAKDVPHTKIRCSSMSGWATAHPIAAL